MIELLMTKLAKKKMNDSAMLMYLWSGAGA